MLCRVLMWGVFMLVILRCVGCYWWLGLVVCWFSVWWFCCGW